MGATSEKPVTYDCQQRQEHQDFNTNHLWEDFIVHYFLAQAVDHHGQVVKQANADCSIWIGKESDYNRSHSTIELLVRELAANLHNGR